MSQGGIIIRFEDVSFDFGAHKPVLTGVSFPIRKGAKLTLMGQNGAGKSTIFKLISGELTPTAGEIHIDSKITIATSKQVIPHRDMELTVREFFQNCFEHTVYDIDPRIEEVLDAVNLNAPLGREIRSFSGGQQARLLMASALIQKPDVLLLDEPTNNLDQEGIEHLTRFLIEYENTVIVISHDSDFLNSFTEGVLYLDVHKKVVDQYVGNYFDAVEKISGQVLKEKRKNAQYEKKIQANKDKANYFAMKGGRMRLLAKRMREEAAEMEESKVDVKKDDKTIRSFTIPFQEGLIGPILSLRSVSVIRNHEPKEYPVHIDMRKDTHLLLSGPNGIGKSTLLERIARGSAEGAVIGEGVRVGYYRQDFSTLDFEETVYQTLHKVMRRSDEHKLRSTAAGMLIDSSIIEMKVGALSEGQKGLVAFAQLVLLEPGLLILDEPTNHINFRHIPIIADALSDYEGAMIVVSHVPDFIDQIRIDDILDLGSKGKKKKKSEEESEG